MEIRGKLLEIFDTVEVSERFRKREFVVEYAENSQFPEFVKFEAVQEKCELLEQFQGGEEVVVSFDLKGRKWNSPQGEIKYFNSLQAWRITPSGKETTETPPPQSTQGTPVPEMPESPPLTAYEGENGNIEEDDLPF